MQGRANTGWHSAYRDETERLAQIERIETITGLKLE